MKNILGWVNDAIGTKLKTTTQAQEDKGLRENIAIPLHEYRGNAEDSISIDTLKDPKAEQAKKAKAAAKEAEEFAAWQKEQARVYNPSELKEENRPEMGTSLRDQIFKEISYEVLKEFKGEDREIKVSYTVKKDGTIEGFVCSSEIKGLAEALSKRLEEAYKNRSHFPGRDDKGRPVNVKMSETLRFNVQ